MDAEQNVLALLTSVLADLQPLACNCFSGVKYGLNLTRQESFSDFYKELLLTISSLDR